MEDDAGPTRGDVRRALRLGFWCGLFTGAMGGTAIWLWVHNSMWSLIAAGGGIVPAFMVLHTIIYSEHE